MMSIPRMHYVAFKCSTHLFNMCQTAKSKLWLDKPPKSLTSQALVPSSHLKFRCNQETFLHCIKQCRLHHDKLKSYSFNALQIFTIAYIQQLLYHRWEINRHTLECKTKSLQKSPPSESWRTPWASTLLTNIRQSQGSGMFKVWVRSPGQERNTVYIVPQDWGRLGLTHSDLFTKPVPTVCFKL